MLRAYGREIANHYDFQKNINTISCNVGDAGEAEGGRRGTNFTGK